MRSDGYSIASDEDVRIDALGRAYRRPPGPVPQPREVVARHRIRFKVNDAERDLIVQMVNEDESTVTELMRDALELLAEERARRRRLNGREG